MSGSTGWKLVLLMSSSFSMWVGHPCARCCVQHRNAVGWGTGREGGWARKQTYIFRKGGGSGAYLAYFRTIPVWFKMHSSSWRSGWAAGWTMVKGGEERWTSRSTSYQSRDAADGRWCGVHIPRFGGAKAWTKIPPHATYTQTQMCNPTTKSVTSIIPIKG